ncbi:MAG: hypothetical protein HY308_17560 [Gammaproteobacteria bacterium]|nr:hypothetical protein [Gammaproteobacteria bacterium]
MKAVWSFWSKPFQATRHRTWLSEAHHLLSWVVSLKTASRHYRPTVLYTDDAGARLLVDELGLEFDQVYTSLNALAKYDAGWWATGKLYTYRAQQEPFVHVDSDVYLWRRLPESLERAPLLAQNPEFFMSGASYYEPETLEAALAINGGGWLPPEWRWYRASGRQQRGENCGVFGGQHVDFIQHYAALALQLIEHRANRRAWRALDRKPHHTVVLEQYLLSACIDYHRNRADSPYRDVDIDYLFSSMDDAFYSDKAVQLGYTHLIANAKQDVDIAKYLETRVAEDWPDYYERCLACS